MSVSPGETLDGFSVSPGGSFKRQKATTKKESNTHTLKESGCGVAFFSTNPMGAKSIRKVNVITPFAVRGDAPTGPSRCRRGPCRAREVSGLPHRRCWRMGHHFALFRWRCRAFDGGRARSPTVGSEELQRTDVHQPARGREIQGGKVPPHGQRGLIVKLNDRNRRTPPCVSMMEDLSDGIDWSDGEQIMQCAKQAFANISDAMNSVARMCQRGAVTRGALTPYLCPDCGQWHLTGSKSVHGHRPRRQPRVTSPRNAKRYRKWRA